MNDRWSAAAAVPGNVLLLLLVLSHRHWHRPHTDSWS